MFASVHIKQECAGIEDVTHSSRAIVHDNSKYTAFNNQTTNCKYYQVPQYWDSNHLLSDYGTKNQIQLHQTIPQMSEIRSLVTVKNNLQHDPYCVDPSEKEATVQSQLNEHHRLDFQQDGQQTQVLQNTCNSRVEEPLLGLQSVPAKSHRPGRPPKNLSESSSIKKIKCQCEICFKEFGHKSNLFIHMRTHNGERPYKCSQCDKCFTHSGNLAIHMRTHSGERPYGCQICGKMFSHSGNLSTHLRTHSGVKPYKCNVCGKEFRHSGNLSIHERIHSGIKPFQCKVCGKDFYHSGNLTTHMKKHSTAVNNGNLDRCENNAKQIVCPVSEFNQAAPSNTSNELTMVPMTNDIKLINNTCNIVPTKNLCSKD